MDNTAPDRQWVTCPGCSEAFDPDTEAAAKSDAGTLQCPFCSTRFVAGAPESASSAVAAASPPLSEAFVVEDDTSADAPAPPRLPYRSARTASEISTTRVRELAAARRALLRIRSWCLVAALSFSVAVVQLVLMTAAHVRHAGWQARPVVYVALALGAAYGAAHFARRVVTVSRELRKPVLDDPQTPPDFSTLSDGSQQWKKLEEM